MFGGSQHLFYGRHLDPRVKQYISLVTRPIKILFMHNVLGATESTGGRLYCIKTTTAVISGWWRSYLGWLGLQARGEGEGVASPLIELLGSSNRSANLKREFVTGMENNPLQNLVQIK